MINMTATQPDSRIAKGGSTTYVDLHLLPWLKSAKLVLVLLLSCSSQSRRGGALWRKTEIAQSSLVSAILISHPPPHPPALQTTNICSKNFNQFWGNCLSLPSTAICVLAARPSCGKCLQTVNYCLPKNRARYLHCFASFSPSFCLPPGLHSSSGKLRKIPKLGTSPRILVP